METKHILVRVRPQRIAMLLAENASKKQFMMVVDFLSRLWGGRYCPIIVVNESDNDIQARQSLLIIRPEIVLFLGVDSSKWSQISEECCQPRKFATLNQDFIKQLYDINRLKLITTNPVIQNELREYPDSQRDNLILYSMENIDKLFSILAVTFGVVPDNEVERYAHALKAKAHKFGNNCDMPLYLKTCTEMSKKWSWLDFASNYLTRHQIGGFVLPPTIVVSTGKVADLVLFWNLRMQAGVGASGYVVLFPAEDIDNEQSVEALSKWLRESAVSANYCVLRSRSTQEVDMQRLAKKLRPRLKGSEIKHVDIKSGTQAVPIVIPYDKEIHNRIYVSGRSFNFDVEKPSFVEELGQFDAWICDLVKDVEDGRALYDLVPPPRKAAIEVLNAPFPPRFNLNMDVIGFGPDCLNIKCSRNVPTMSLGMPTDEELLQEVLAGCGITLTKDEKRIRYVQALRMLGGLKDAFLAFSGGSLKVIEALLSGPLTINEMKSKAKLDKDVQDANEMVFDLFNKYLPAHARRIGQKRFKQYYQQNISKNISEEEITEKLIQCGAIRRKWKLSKCKFCDKEYWVDSIDIKNVVKCPGCDGIITLSGQVTLGYELNELIHLAVKEGVIPVVMTANFLYNTTSKGFIWLSGAKCSTDGLNADLDILACCDGHLVAAECKMLAGTTTRSAAWAEIFEQVDKAIAVAKKCGVEAFVFGSFCRSYPKTFQDKLRRLAGTDMTVAFLGNNDLQTGRRYISKVRPLLIEDLLARRTVRRKKKRRRSGKRIIRF